MLDRLTRAGARAAGILMVAMMAIICAEVVARQAFDFSFLVVDELSGYLLVAIAFLGVADSLRAGAMIRVEFLLLRTPPGLRRGIGLLHLLLAMAFTLVLAVELGKLVVSSYTRNIVSAAVFQIPQFIPQLVMPLGLVLLLLALADRARRLLGSRSDGDAAPEERP